MEPHVPNSSNESSGGAGAPDSDLSPGMTFQPVVISPTQSQSPSTGSTASNPAADEDHGDALNIPAAQSSPELQPRTGLASAWPSEPQLKPPVATSHPPVPSLAVPKPGSLTPSPTPGFMSEPTPAVTTPQQPANMPIPPQAPHGPSAALAYGTPTPGNPLPATPAVPMTSSFNSSGIDLAAAADKPKRGKKSLLISGGVALILLMIAGGVFGLYWPNTPANVYKTGINRSGKALNELVTTATDEKQLESYKTSSIKGSVAANMDGGSYSGDFTTTFDKTSMDGGLSVQLKEKNTPTKTVTVKALSKIPAGGIYPDVWFQIAGLKAAGYTDAVPELADYDGKWISISSDYIKKISDNYGLQTGDNTKDQVTASDIAELARVTTNVTQQYLFSTDPAKAVFEQKQFVGKEDMDGLKVYHYKVGVNVDHAKAYCLALSDALYDTKVVKKLSGETDKELADDKKAGKKDCSDTVKDMVKSSDTFDLWIDGKYKLVHKIRIYAKDDKNSYTDVGQTYLGGSKLSLFMAFHDDKGKTDGNFTLDTDFKAAKTSGKLTYKNTDKDYPYDVTVKMDAEASAKPVTVTPPSSAVPIQDVLKKLGLDSYLGDTSPSGGGSVALKAADTERQTDINTIRSYLEAFYGDEGRYPTLVELNDSKWRATNAGMKGLSNDAIQPPSSTTTTFAAKASTTQYGYQPKGCGTDGCQDFTLTALLSDGTTYQKDSLNASDTVAT